MATVEVPPELPDAQTIALWQQPPASYTAWAQVFAPLGPAWIESGIFDGNEDGGDLLQDRQSKIARRIKAMATVLSRPNKRAPVLMTRYATDIFVLFVTNPKPLDQSVATDGAKVLGMCFETPLMLQVDVCRIPAYPGEGPAINVFTEVSEAIGTLSGALEIVCNADRRGLALHSLLRPDDAVNTECYVAAAAATAISAHFNCTVHVRDTHNSKHVSVNGIKCCNGALLGVALRKTNVSRGWNQIPLVTRTENGMSAASWKKLLLPKVGRPRNGTAKILLQRNEKFLTTAAQRQRSLTSSNGRLHQNVPACADAQAPAERDDDQR